MSQSLEAKIPSESSLVNEELKKNLKMIFERLVRPVCLKAVLDPGTAGQRGDGILFEGSGAAEPLDRTAAAGTGRGQ